MDINKKISNGTTIIAYKFKDGIIVNADSRTSSDTRIANRVQRKIVQFNEHVLVACSGSAADTRFLCRIIRENIYQHELELGKPALVRTVAKLFSVYNHQYKNVLLAGLLVCGYDEEGYHCFKVLPGGTFVEDNIVMSGSGSTYVYGIADSEFKMDLDRNQAVELGKKMIHLAAFRDGSSGGIHRWAFVENGKVTGDVDNWEVLM
ncbi:Proteasome_subunit beta type [Hexamita inflata]|uniref:proteasome endopeptidase complex n=1 Tax=Hexamita inflata TaxID=28002 RepID=A0AA86VGH5_9EUKA|nr:Proteasome subunit beta type [Hexamita inflata]